MKLSHKLSLAGLFIGLLSIPLDGDSIGNTRDNLNPAKIKTELDYYKQAAVLNDLLFREGTPVHMQIVVNMLKEIDKDIVKYYPDGPFTRNDLIALGWVESAFRQYENGTHGERGIFQIMPDEFHDFNIKNNYYNIDVNTNMAFRVLKAKYDKHKDYKRAIMAYNGLVKSKHGKYSDKYWKAFEKRKIAIDLALAVN